MAFPDLTVKSGGSLTSEATGTPVNGNNTFAVGIDPDLIDNTDWLEFTVTPLGASVTNATFTSLSGDKTQVTINFTQSGADQAKVVAVQKHSIIR